MKPKIVMTSRSPWDFGDIKRIIESVELKNPVVSTGRTWDGRNKLIVEWDEEI